MKPEYSKTIQKEINKRRYFNLIILIIPIIILIILLNIIIIFESLFKFILNISDEQLTMIISIPIICITLYFIIKDSDNTFVPIRIFLTNNEKILFTSNARKRSEKATGSGICYLTNKRLIFLPTEHSRNRKKIYEMFVEYDKIKSIAKNKTNSYYLIKTDIDKYIISLKQEDKWIEFLEKNHVNLLNKKVIDE